MTIIFFFRAVVPLQTRFLDCSDFSPRWWLLEQVILFCNRKETRKSLLNIVGPPGFFIFFVF